MTEEDKFIVCTEFNIIKDKKQILAAIKQRGLSWLTSPPTEQEYREMQRLWKMHNI